MLVVLQKRNSVYQFSFWKDKNLEGVKIFVNSEASGYNVSVEFAKNEIKRLIKNGYKKIEYPHLSE